MLSKLARRSARITANRFAAVMPLSSFGPKVLFSVQMRGFCASSSGVEKLEFKAETRKLLDIVAKSLYTDKEVFIRELISNASDALEKFRFLSSTHQIKTIADPELTPVITLEVDEANRTFSISDTGIGMSRAELIENLGTIARSGSKKFIEEVGAADNKIIGQFGVGFYSSFVVADKVQVYSKSSDLGKDVEGCLWESDGMGSFTVTPAEGLPRGTKIVIHLKEEAAEFCKIDTVRSAAKKFSSFVDFELKIVESKDGQKKEEIIPRQDALWLKSTASEEEHIEFFRYLSGTSYGDPMYSLMFHTDAPLSIKSVFYIPEDAPNRWFSQGSSKAGVSLHSRRVLVTKHADSIIPQWLHWVKGVVDCEDMPLNISRENMQDSALLKKLSTAVVRRILRFLGDESRKDKSKYDKFWTKYSFYIKAGLLDDQQHNGGLHRDLITKLLRFETVESSDLISLEEYVDKMPSGQENIYYINSPDRRVAKSSPYMDGLKGKTVLLLNEDVDEFVVSYIEKFKEKKLVSIDSMEGVERDAQEEHVSHTTHSDYKLNDDEKTIVESLFKDVLGKRITTFKFTDRIVSTPAVVTSQISPHMRRMMKNIIAHSGEKSNQADAFEGLPTTLEVNERNSTIKTIAELAAKEDKKDVCKMAIQQIYDNAAIAAGMLEDPRAILGRLNELVETCVFQAAGKSKPQRAETATNAEIKKEEASSEQAEPVKA